MKKHWEKFFHFRIRNLTRQQRGIQLLYRIHKASIFGFSLFCRILLLLCISSFCPRTLLGKDQTMQRMNYLKDLFVSSLEKGGLPAAAEGTTSLVISMSFLLRVKITEVKRISEKPVQ